MPRDLLANPVQSNTPKDLLAASSTKPKESTSPLYSRGFKQGIKDFGTEVKNSFTDPNNPIAGAIKGLGSTLFGIGQLSMQRDKVTGLNKLYGQPDIPKEKPKALQPEGTGQKIGYGLEQGAEYLLPGGATTNLEKAAVSKLSQFGLNPLIKKSLNVGARSTVEGLAATTVKTAQSGDLKEGLKTGLVSTVASVPFKAFSELSKPLGSAFQQSAEKKASQALGATTKHNKELADKVVPELLKRKVTFVTRKGLLSKAESSIDDTGEQLAAAYDKLPDDAKIKAAPILKTLSDLKNKFVVKGTNVVADKEGYKAAKEMQQLVIDTMNKDGDIPVDAARSLRQILDNAQKRTGKSFALSATDSAMVAAKKETANALRNELAQNFPDIAKINKEYTFWKNVEQIVGSTIQRTKSQATPLAETIAEGAGVVAGATAKGGLGGAVLGAIGFRLLKQAVTSPGWRQTSAIVRSQIADALASGQVDKANVLLNRIINGAISQ